ncbi:MAG: DUF1150 family protein [Pseudomonadota bacterium]
MTIQNETPQNLFTDRLVYVKPLNEAELSNLIEQNAIEGWDPSETVFALYNAEGVRVAVVEGRDAAFAAARLNELKPQSVH